MDAPAPVRVLLPGDVAGDEFEVILDETHGWDGRTIRLREYAMKQGQDKRPGNGDRASIAMHWRLSGYPDDVVLHLYERRYYRVTVINNG